MWVCAHILMDVCTTMHLVKRPHCKLRQPYHDLKSFVRQQHQRLVRLLRLRQDWWLQRCSQDFRTKYFRLTAVESFILCLCDFWFTLLFDRPQSFRCAISMRGKGGAKIGRHNQTHMANPAARQLYHTHTKTRHWSFFFGRQIGASFCFSVFWCFSVALHVTRVFALDHDCRATWERLVHIALLLDFQQGALAIMELQLESASILFKWSFGVPWNTLSKLTCWTRQQKNLLYRPYLYLYESPSAPYFASPKLRSMCDCKLGNECF